MSGWSPGVYAAIAFGSATLLWSTGPTLIQGLSQAYSYAYKWRFPYSTSVQRRTLDDADIPLDGNLHRNLPFPPTWQEQCFNHQSGDHCWLSFLNIFNILDMPPTTYRPKPDQLELQKKYFLTDARTIFICILSLVENHLHRFPEFSEDDGKGGQRCKLDEWNEVSFRRKDDLLLAHFKIEGIRLSKCDRLVNRRTVGEYRKIIVDGYPPWYRRSARNAANVAFEFPILENGNLWRGGWILAIRLGDLDPLPFVSSELAKVKISLFNSDLSISCPYENACRYFLDVIYKRFTSEAFTNPQDQAIIATAREEVDTMVTMQTASLAGIYLGGTPLEGALNRGWHMASLDGPDIEFAIEVFNNRKPLDVGEVERLKPQLLPIMAGAIRGIANVYSYFSNNLTPIIPYGMKHMIDNNPEIYLEGCQA
jgi:hypothetical protein